MVEPTTTISETASLANPQQLPTPPKWNWLRLYKWWLLLIGCLGVIIIVLLAAIALKPKTPHTTSPTPTPTIGASVTPTTDTSQSKYFSQLSQSLVYYSFAQTSGNRNVFQADPTDTQQRNINIGFPDTYTFLASPDGHWLIRYNDRQIEQATSQDPTSFTTIYQLPGAQLRVTSAVFATDSSSIAINMTQASQTPAGNQQSYYTNQLITIPISANKTKPTVTTLINSDKPYRFKLLGYPDSHTLWYAEDRDSRISNLSRLQLSPTQSTTTYTIYNSQLSTMQFTPDMHYAYSQSGLSITQSDLTNQQARIVYSLDNSCPGTNQVNSSGLTGLSVSPTNQLLIAIAFKSCPNQPQPSPGAVPPSTQRTIIFNPLTGQISQQQDNQPLTSFSEGKWSPDGQHVWLTIDPSTHYELDIEHLQIHAIPSLDRQTITKEKLYFIAWLSAWPS